MRRELLADVRKIVSHAGCPDGFASALILRHVLPHAEVVFVEHSTPEYAGLPAEPGMIFCDIIPPAARAGDFLAAGALVLDHHKGARELVASFGERGVFADEVTEPGVSGASLAFREVWSELAVGEAAAARPQVERFARRAGIRDTWQRDDSEWDEACAQAAALLFFGYTALAEQPWLDEEHMAVGRRLVAQRRAEATATARDGLFRLKPHVAVYNDRDGSVSDVAQAAFDLDEHIQMVAGFRYRVTSDGQLHLVFSLRSRLDGLDVAALAKRAGGGGHRSAAGFGVVVSLQSLNPLATLNDLLESTEALA